MRTAATMTPVLVPARVLGALNWNVHEAVFVLFVVSGFLMPQRARERGALASIARAGLHRRRFARIAP